MRNPNQRILTEDDTFLRLVKISWKEMDALITDWICDDNDERKLEDVLRHNGWTIEDYNCTTVLSNE